MKIQKYQDSEIFDLYASHFIKKSSAKSEVAEAAWSLAEAMGTGLRKLWTGAPGESARLQKLISEAGGIETAAGKDLMRQLNDIDPAAAAKMQSELASAIGPPKIREGEAIFDAPDGHIPVTITGEMGIMNGERYYSVLNYKGGLPESKLIQEAISGGVGSAAPKALSNLGGEAAVALGIKKTDVAIKEMSEVRTIIESLRPGESVESLISSGRLPSGYSKYKDKSVPELVEKLSELHKGALARNREMNKKLTDALRANDVGSSEFTAAKKALDASEAALKEYEGTISKLQSKVTGLEGDVASLGQELGHATGRAEAYKEVAEKLMAIAPGTSKADAEEIARLAGEVGRLKAIVEKGKQVGEAADPMLDVMSKRIEELEKQLASKKSIPINLKPDAAGPIQKSIDEATEVGSKQGAKEADDMASAASKSKKSKPAGSVGDPTDALTDPTKVKDTFWGQVLFGKDNPAKDLLVWGAGGLFSMIKTLALVVGGVMVWNYMWSEDPNAAKLLVEKNDREIDDSIAKLKALQFSLSEGGQKTLDLIAALESGKQANLSLLAGSDLTPEQMKTAADSLGNLELKIEAYINERGVIKGDLVSLSGWDEAITSLATLKDSLMNMKKTLYSAAKASGKGTGPAAPTGTGQIAGPGKRGAVTTNIYGKSIDISHVNEKVRNMAPRIIKNVLNTPAGMAFIDPKQYTGPDEGIWGGYLDSSGGQEAHYLESLKWLIGRGIMNQGQLIGEMRSRLGKGNLRKGTGWRNALKHYRRFGGKYITANNNEKLSKTANLPNSSDCSINRRRTGMNKIADQFAKTYYQDAVKGLSEQYAKSYYTGLKSMYDQKLGKPKADYKELYEAHGGTGAELVGKAHPYSADIADAMGRGGRVENVLEQHKHNVGVALSTPTGNFRQKHAYVVESLVKLANRADDEGMIEISDLIDSVLDSFET